MKLLLFLFISLFLITTPVQGTSKDLQELAARYEEAAAQGDMDVELVAIEPYLAAAIRQKNDREERLSV